MGAWKKNKVDSSQINGGQEYTRDSNPSLEQLNAITNNSFYAVDKADEAIIKANSAFENNGTVVSVGGSTVANLSFNGDPQEQINSKASISDLNATNSNISSLSQNKANSDLSNVTYPQVVASGTVQTGAGDRVIESYISSDGNTWYRKWESGWKECGLNNVDVGIERQLPIAFNTVNYIVSFEIVSYTGTAGIGADVLKTTKNKTSIKIGDSANWEGIKFGITLRGY